MRLSPKSIFFGIVALGLPFAVTVGWALGTPDSVPQAASSPGGAGGLGAAPVRIVPSQPVTAVEYSSRPPRPGAGPTEAPAGTTPATVPPVIATTTAPTTKPVVTLSALPTLTLPPVPTPTEVTVPPSSPSATPSSDDSESAERRFGGARLVRRQ